MNQLVVWYDAACPPFRHEVDLMRRTDRTGAMCFLDATQDNPSCPIDRANLLARLPISENEGMLSAAAAFAAKWRAVPILRPVGLAARRLWVLTLLEFEHAYRQFLRTRPALQDTAVRGST